jgi:hypothetical protein
VVCGEQRKPRGVSGRAGVRTQADGSFLSSGEVIR